MTTPDNSQTTDAAMEMQGGLRTSPSREAGESRDVRPPADPHSVWQGSFPLFGVDVKCHVLSTGERIIEAESMQNLLEAMGAPGTVLDHAEMEEFAKWQKGIR